jgi:hypothetical protein
LFYEPPFSVTLNKQGSLCSTFAAIQVLLTHSILQFTSSHFIVSFSCSDFREEIAIAVAIVLPVPVTAAHVIRFKL